MSTTPTVRRTLLGGLLCVVTSLASCLSPPPDLVRSPDESLADLLSELQEVRGEDFARSDGLSHREAGAEGRILAGVRALALEHPRHVPTLLANASITYEGGDSIGAQKYLDQALALDPAHVPATLLRVRIAAESGNLPFARRKLEEQLDIVPDEPALHEALAGILYLDGDFAGSATALDRAQRLRDEADATGYSSYHRGLVAEAAGDLEVARDHYLRSLELDPNHEAAGRRLRWLESGDLAPAGSTVRR